jgi:peptidoglycan hydrolase-like protein with peptidoglycan-binding domain
MTELVVPLPDPRPVPITEADEIDVLTELYGPMDANGLFRSDIDAENTEDALVFKAAPRGTPEALVEWMRARIGMGEGSGSGQNEIQKKFRSRVSGSYWSTNWPWCQASICVGAYETGSFAEVMFNVWDAYTVTAANRFATRGQWKSGTAANMKKYGKPGAIVYFDWDGSDSIGRTDHVGIVEKVLPDGRFQTLEGNAGNRLGRHVRSSNVVSGFGLPKYKGSSGPAPVPAFQPYVMWPANGKPFGLGTTGVWTKSAQTLLKEKKLSVTVNGVYDAATEAAVKKFQVDNKIASLTPEAVARIAELKARIAELTKQLSEEEKKTNATGVVDSKTYALLVYKQVIKRGDMGSMVEAVQTLLNRHGAKLSVDGDFGPATEAAVKAFQIRKGYKTNYPGRVYSGTWVLLNENAK